jgi:hypothetical protein
VTDFSTAVANAQTEIQQFLVAQGFKETEIKQGNVQMKDMLARQEGTDKKTARFVGTGEISVSSGNVELAGSTREIITGLLQKGVPVSGSTLQYYFTDLNSIKGDMLKEATANARTVAAAFAENSGVRLTTLQSASQDAFEVREPVSAGQPGSNADTGNGSISKKVSVVVNVDFATSDR